MWMVKLQGNGTGMLAVFGAKLRLVNCTLRGGTGDWVRQIPLSSPLPHLALA